MTNQYIKLAHDTLKYFLKTGKTLKIPADCPKDILNKKAGCFVSLHKGKELRGCIGTYLPTKQNLAEEIIANSIAASRDPRFSPITNSEFPDLSVKVDVLSKPQETNMKELNPKIYGLIVKSNDGRTGLLLPDLEGVDTTEQQINICRQKASISPNEPIDLYRFTVERHQD